MIGSVVTVLAFLILSYCIYKLFEYLVDWDKVTLLLLSFVLGPMVLGWFLFELILLVPGQRTYFYPIVVLSLSVILFLIKPVKEVVFDFKKALEKVLEIIRSFSNMDKDVMCLTVLILCILVGIMTLVVFWPPSWSDQLTYILQAKGVVINRNLSVFGKLQQFRFSGSWFSNNTMVRPGLTMVYAFYFFCKPSFLYLGHIVNFVATYYWIIMVATAFYVSYRRRGVEVGLLTVLLTITVPYLNKFLIMGSKELILIPLILLLIDLISSSDAAYTNIEMLVFGLILGFMSMINFSGVIMASIIGILALIFRRRSKTLIGSLLLLIGVCLIAHFEISFFLNWLDIDWFSIDLSNLSNGARKISLIKDIVTTKDTIGSELAQTELPGYGIANKLQIFTNGKLQAFTHIHHYGLLFWGFLITSALNFKKIVKNRFLKINMIWIIVYYVLIIDLFNLNPHPRAYVLTINPKYHMMIAPSMAVMLASLMSESGIISNNKAQRLWKFTGITVGVLSLLIFIYPKFFIHLLGKVWGRVLPLTLSAIYYTDKLRVVGGALIVGFVVVKLLSFLWKDSKNKNALRKCLIYWMVFVVPFLSYFGTEYQFDIYKHLFGAPIEKAEAFSKGNRNFFPIIKFLNKESKYENSLIITSSGHYPKMLFYLDKHKYSVARWSKMNAFQKEIQKNKSIILVWPAGKVNNMLERFSGSSKLIYERNGLVVYYIYEDE